MRDVYYYSQTQNRCIPNGKDSESVHVSVEGEKKLGSINLTSVYYKHPSVMPHTQSHALTLDSAVIFFLSLSQTRTHSQKGEVQGEGH